VAVSTLRVHFTLEDLARTRVAPGPDVMWETTLSLIRLQGRYGLAAFGGWRGQVAGKVDRSVRLLLPLLPTEGYFADFLTPGQGLGGLAAGIDAVRRTPRGRLRTEVQLLSASRRLPVWTSRLAEGDVQTMEWLGQALERYFSAAVDPYWSTVVRQVEADRALRTRAFLDGGCEGVLASLRSFARWRPPVLEVNYPVDRDLHLGGRGLLLVPSLFCYELPVTLLDEEQQPVLVYPIDRGLWFPNCAVAGAPVASTRPLAPLLGPTRATVFAVVDSGCTTTELARRAGISLASASEHASVLREAGLLATQRRGGSVLHSLTPLGIALLDGSHD
jgi:DNA-binding transcriptional ArsR family regulator